MLLEAIESLERGEGIEVTPQYWAERRARLIAQFETEQEEAKERRWISRSMRSAKESTSAFS